MAATAQADNGTPGKTEWRALRIDDFEVVGYEPHAPIRADVAV